MKITKDYLKQIIKEEVEQMVEISKEELYQQELQKAVLALEKQFGKGSISIGNKPAREVAGMEPAPEQAPVQKPTTKVMPKPQAKPQQYIQSRDFGKIPVGAIDTSREGT